MSSRVKYHVDMLGCTNISFRSLREIHDCLFEERWNTKVVVKNRKTGRVVFKGSVKEFFWSEEKLERNERRRDNIERLQDADMYRLMSGPANYPC